MNRVLVSTQPGEGQDRPNGPEGNFLKPARTLTDRSFPARAVPPNEGRSRAEDEDHVALLIRMALPKGKTA